MANIQHRLTKVRPPRVQITYDIEIGNAFITKELPFNMGIIANLHGDTIPVKDYKERQFINIDAGNVMEVMQTINPTINIIYSLKLSAIGEKDIKSSYILNFTNINNFHPDSIIETIPEIKDLYHRIQHLKEVKLKSQNNTNSYLPASIEVINTTDDIGNILTKYNINHTDNQEIIHMYEELRNSKLVDINENNIILLLQQRINKMESIIMSALNEILHLPSFQTLEASWRGIIYILSNLSISTSLCLKIFDCSIKEFASDLNNALDFDQSYLFQKIYEEQYGTYGGSPFNIIGLDHYVGYDSVSIGLLTKFSQLMSAAHCVGIVGASSSLLDIDNFTQLYKIRDVATLFSSKAYVQFRGFRDLDESKYIGIVMPKFMVRLPYDSLDNPIDKIPDYKEEVTVNEDSRTNDHSKYCWSNSIYVYLTRIGESFFNYGWFGAIIGPENGGLVPQLNIALYKNEDAELMIKCPTETLITDRKEKEISSQGLISLCYCKDTNQASFFSSVSCNKPVKYNTPAATANAILSSRLQYMLNISRFAHYLKVMARDKIGSYSSAESLQIYLSDWIADYILLNETNDIDINTRYPLTGASITVTENESRPGTYEAVLLIQPRLQMEEIKFSLRLVAKLNT